MVTVAQLVEHWVVILVVAGSSPVGHTKNSTPREYPGVLYSFYREVESVVIDT